MAGNDTTIDLKALEAEVGKMSKEDLEKAVLDLRVREKKQQKKMQGSETQKRYQERQKAIRKLLKEQAKKLGIYDRINEQAETLAEQQLAAETEPEGAEEEEVA